MTPSTAASTNCADASCPSADAQRKVGVLSHTFGHRHWNLCDLNLSCCDSAEDDADAGEIKKSHKSVRRRQREAAVNQKQEEAAAKRQWQAHRSSVSSHSSGDEVRLPFERNQC